MMPYSFQPRILLSAFCLVLIITFSLLGGWQLQRSDEKQQQLSELEALAELPPSSLNEAPHKHQVATKVTANGHYLAQDQFLLDNIVHQGKPGYYLLTPFSLSESKEVILVNRGWIAKESHGLPNLATSSEIITLTGTLAPPRSKPVILGGIDQPISDTPPLWYYMDIEVFKEHAGYNVLPLVLRLAPDLNSGFVRDWPQFQAKSGMHIGYAIQWFVFAFFVLIALVSINFKNNTKPNKNNTNNNGD